MQVFDTEVRTPSPIVQKLPKLYASALRALFACIYESPTIGAAMRTLVKAERVFVSGLTRSRPARARAMIRRIANRKRAFLHLSA